MSRRPGQPRHRSREAALQVLYALDFGPAGEPSEPGEARAQEVLDGVTAHFDLPEGARAFAKELVLGLAEHREAVDDMIARHALNWRLPRMAAVDRNILRLAVYELTVTDAPAAVVIDEAVELAGRFGGESSSAFVNGVLDAVARTLQASHASRA